MARERTLELIGRSVELAQLAALVDARSEGGSNALVVGDPGIGKSRLLDAVADYAAAHGVRVLTATGTESESRLPYATLHSLLRRLVGNIDRLPVRQRDALRNAFGMTEHGPTDLFLVALATLELLADAAEPTGLMITVDDLHLVDQSSLDVLAFVARRVDTEPVVLIGALRSGHPLPAGLDQHHLTVGPLTDRDAAIVIGQRAPDLAAGLRRAVLDAAEGNPLALLELPTRLTSAPRGWREPVLPLSARLERAFADRVATLPAVCRTVLLAAVVTDTGDLDETVATATQLVGSPVTLDDLEPAFTVGLLRLDGLTLRFRHPLVRAAIYQRVDTATKRAAHRALAVVLTDAPDRRAWQLALASIGRDEAVAQVLDVAAERARRRGATTAALNAIQRAAELSSDPARRADRLLAATELAVEVGQPDTVADLLDQLGRSPLTPVQGAHLAWIRELREDGIKLRPDMVHRMVELARTCQHNDAPNLALKILHAAALRCFWSTGDADAADAVARATDALVLKDDVPSLQFIWAAVRPVERGPQVLRSLHRIDPDTTPSPVSTNIQGLAAVLLGDMAVCSRTYEIAEAGYRRTGQLGRLAQVLVSHAAASVFRGLFQAARDNADEAIGLSRDLAGPRWHAAALMTTTAAAACLGLPIQPDAVESTLATLANPAQWAQLAHTRGLVALAGGRYEEAYEHLRPIFTPGERAYHPTFRTWVIGDLAEAAIHRGKLEDLPMLIEELAQLELPSPLLAAGLGYARAAMSAGEQAQDLYLTAVSAADDYPFLQARSRLEHGSWLRRRHRPAAARSALQAALNQFNALGVQPWEERARAELLAAGGRASTPAQLSIKHLSAQELRIAKLAAQGLTNRQIGQQLFLSHRTVSAHLYRIFPKLGITRRNQLRDAINQ